MNTRSEAGPQLDVVDVAGPAKSNETASTTNSSKADFYAMAELRMRRGRGLVIGGFVVAVLGIVAYCIVCLSAAANQKIGATLIESPGWLVAPTLGVVGLGTLLWLAGSLMYFTGAMDSDPSGPDMYF